MLDKYQTNLLSALSTMASSGFISRRKFLELLSSLGIELSEEGKDYLVCKMLLKSESLNKLSYMIILDWFFYTTSITFNYPLITYLIISLKQAKRSIMKRESQLDLFQNFTEKEDQRTKISIGG